MPREHFRPQKRARSAHGCCEKGRCTWKSRKRTAAPSRFKHEAASTRSEALVNSPVDDVQICRTPCRTCFEARELGTQKRGTNDEQYAGMRLIPESQSRHKLRPPSPVLGRVTCLRRSWNGATSFCRFPRSCSSGRPCARRVRLVRGEGRGVST